ncbi:OsmC family protein [Streptococcus hillyeri]|uniref:OsmC family peroxiredoxin n=1 Tax=Streptococcus hillyeri TaxID=2282420 RepID=A0A3L9DW91_9STRE|nr:OsmC family protein [Streptococcus hillyeri]RLY04203.1 OsmC family peroxiredoxin [Streptococcus hillyeri]
MYQTKITGDRLYHALSSGYGEPVETFGVIDEGETPMSLLVIALSSCVTMCVQGYYKRMHGLERFKMETLASYDDGKFELNIQLPAQLLSETDQEALRDYANRHCRVKQLLRENVTVSMTFEGVA